MKKVFLCILGVLFLGLGIYVLIHRFMLRKDCTVQARGVVSFIPYEPDSKKYIREMKFFKIVKPLAIVLGQGKEVEKIEEREKLAQPVMYYEVITFPVNGVERVVKTGHDDDGTFKYSMGQNVVTVAYDPANPDRYRVLEKKGEILGGIVFVFLGSICAIVSWNL